MSFWMTVTSFFTNKGMNKQNITLVENGEPLSNNLIISLFLITPFSDAVKKLDIIKNEDQTADTSDIGIRS